MPYADPNKQREYCRAWVRARRAAYFADKKCAHCGRTDTLELHHVDPSTKVSHRIWSWAEARRAIELLKCIVLCEECHVIVRDGVPEHGTYRMYKHHRCRCIMCKAANAATERSRLSSQWGVAQPGRATGC